MRNAFCSTLIESAANPAFVFLTGDLGFRALEPLRNEMGERFINAGIAEQNMVSVAAGLAKEGLRPWVYSIAPFLYARAFEQIRNDVCLHNMPVVMVGNGGGYGYGVMGSTHHAVEDYGALLSLLGMRVYLPAFDFDVNEVIPRLMRTDHPAYLRLGLSEQPKWFSPPPFAAWRHLLAGVGPTIAIAGPLAGGILDAVRQSDIPADVWLVSELPITELPSDFLSSLGRSNFLMVIEEHVAGGSFGQMLSRELLLAGIAPRHFVHRTALGYVSGRYGSQRFHRAECGLDPDSIAAEIKRAVMP
jgi:transketolase